MTVSTIGGFGRALQGDRLVVMVVATIPVTTTVTDNVGDVFAGPNTNPVNCLTSSGTTTKIVWTGTAIGANVPSTVTATFTGTNGQRYGMLLLSLAYTSNVGLLACSSKSVTAATSVVLPQLSTSSPNSFLVTGISILTGSCHDTIVANGSPTIPNILNILNQNCTNGNNEWTLGVQGTITTGSSSQTGTTINDNYTWTNLGNAFAWVLEMKSGTVSRATQLYFDSETQTSTTVVSGTNTVIRSALEECCALGGALVEAEGYVSTSVGSLSQPLTFTFTNAGTPTCSATVIQTLTALDTFAFAFKCLPASGAGQVISLTYTAANTDGATTIFVNSYRLYLLP